MDTRRAQVTFVKVNKTIMTFVKVNKTIRTFVKVNKPIIFIPRRSRRRASAHYLVEAALRLILMDFTHSEGTVDDRITILKDVCVTVLSSAEAEALRSPFEPLSTADAELLIQSIGFRWREPGSVLRERAALAPVAHAILVRDDDALESPISLLDRAERLSTLCAAREELRRAVSTAVPWAGDAAAVRSWVLFRAAAVHSEAAAKSFADAIAADRLDPAMLPFDEARSAVSAISTRAAVSALLISQHPDTATRAAADSRAGVASITTASVRDVAVLAFAVFHYAARQLHGVSWAESYTATDARPEAAVQRLRRYAAEKMLDPPPILVLVDQAVYAVYKRTANAHRVTAHADGFSALAEWVSRAAAHPSVGPRYRAVLREAAAGAPKRTDDVEPALPLVRL